jgi:hypothetical protein
LNIFGLDDVPDTSCQNTNSIISHRVATICISV